MAPAEATWILLERATSNQHPGVTIEFELVDATRFDQDVKVDGTGDHRGHIEHSALLSGEFFQKLKEVAARRIWNRKIS